MGSPAYELDKQAKIIRQLGLENDGKATIRGFGAGRVRRRALAWIPR